MRTRIAFGVMIAALALTVASPAYAKKTKPKVFFGEFVAERAEAPITPADEAEVSGHAVQESPTEEAPAEFHAGPFDCAKVGAGAKIDWEHSETFRPLIVFKKCAGVRRLEGGIEEHVTYKMGKTEWEFHANGSGTVGEPSGEVTITKPGSIKIKSKGGVCEVELPDQSIPAKAETKPEREYEAITYSNEEEPVEPSKKNLKRYPSGFKDRLEIEWEGKAKYEVPAGKEQACGYSKEESRNYNPETHKVVIKGTIYGYVEELEIKNGEFYFKEP